MTPEGSGGHKAWGWIGLGVLLIGVFVAWFLLPVDAWIRGVSRWIEGLGFWGVVVFGFGYVLGTIVLAPGSLMSIAAGLVFGGWGIPIVSVAATIGASLAFLIARYLARQQVVRIIERRPKFKAIDHAVQEEGWKIVVLLRLSPLIPFNLQNYVFGLTDVRFLSYVAATFVGIIPGTLLYVYLGMIGKAAGGGDEGGMLRWIFFGAGLLATVVVAVLVARKARTKLEQAGLREHTNAAFESNHRQASRVELS